MNLRFVLGPDGKIWFDPSGKAPGDALELPVDRKLFDQQKSELESLKGEIPSDLCEQVKSVLNKRFLQNLALAKKANKVFLGAEDVRGNTKKLGFALCVVDAGKDALKRIEALESQGVRTYKYGSNAELSDVLGVPACSLVGVARGKMANNIAELIEKIQAFTNE